MPVALRLCHGASRLGEHQVPGRPLPNILIRFVSQATTEPYNISDTALHAGRLQRGVSGTAEGAAAVTVWVKNVSSCLTSRGNTIDNDPLLYHSVQTREKAMIGGAESGQNAATYCARIRGRPPESEKRSPWAWLMRITRRASFHPMSIENHESFPLAQSLLKHVYQRFSRTRSRFPRILRSCPTIDICGPSLDNLDMDISLCPQGYKVPRTFSYA